MKWFRKTKEERDKFIFDYDNFIMKSSQKRYAELENEVKIDKIEDKINIAGNSAKEKKHNLLMHYKNLVDTFDFVRESSRDEFQPLSNFITIVVMILVAWLPYGISLIEDTIDDIMTNDVIISLLAIYFLIAIVIVSIWDIYSSSKKIKKESQEYLYYKFYYNELKKYIKED